MRIKIALIAFIFICFDTHSQNSIIKKVNYANIEIEVPANYIANSEYEIENDNFSAQWLYLSKEMFDQNVQYQIIKQFEDQTKVKEISENPGTMYEVQGHTNYTGKEARNIALGEGRAQTK